MDVFLRWDPGTGEGRLGTCHYALAWAADDGAFQRKRFAVVNSFS